VTDSDSDTGTETDSDTGVDTGDLVCDNLPALPRPATHIEGIYASEDFVFDKDGNILQVVIDNAAVVRKNTYDGTSQILAAMDVLWPQGTRLLPNGELIVTNADRNELIRIYPNGSVEPFANGIAGPNGIAVNMEGILYVTSREGRVYRVDPVANTYRTVIDISAASFDGITFSPDYRTLYFDEEMGIVHKAAVNEDGTLGESEELVNIFEAMHLLDEEDFTKYMLDGMTVDRCGNLYVVEMSGRIYRVSPNGEVETAVDLYEAEGIIEGEVFIPAVNFGSGYGGWKADHLYIASFVEVIYEVNMGVTGKDEPHLP
jgi:hypothetical protein